MVQAHHSTTMNTVFINRIDSHRSKRALARDAVRGGPLSSPMIKSLCDTCSLIYGQVLQRMGRITRDKGVILAQCRTIDLKTNRTCAMCRLLSFLKDDCAFEDGVSEANLIAYSSRKSYPQGYTLYHKQPNDLVLICLAPSEAPSEASSSKSYAKVRYFPRGNGFISFSFQNTGNSFKPQPLGRHVNFALLRGWLQECKRLHDKHIDERDRNSVTNPEMLRLIDCQTRRVVVAKPDDQYVALSYVWGPLAQDDIEATNADSMPSSVLEHIPNTISDAIEVTLQLGLQYIWVDKYCILQNSEADKRHQVSRMDAIYQNAEITIIAAAGETSDYGLPGVKSCLRDPIQDPGILSRPITLTPPHPDRDVRTSKWSTRGWVYQEAVLSRRRLIFTDREVYFECNNMQCREAIETRPTMFPPRLLRSNEKTLSIFPPLGEDPLDILKHISDYSKREFSRSDDIINGIIGIQKAFTNTFSSKNANDAAPCAFWGLPVLHTSSNFRRPVLDNKPKKWTMGLLRGMQWRSSQPSARRPGFPSWSWTGWMGSVEWPGDLEFSYDIPDGDIGIRVSWRSTDKQEEIDDIEEKMPALQDPSEANACLQVEGWTIQLRLEHLPNGPPKDWLWGKKFNRGPGWYVRLHDQPIAFSPAYLSIEANPGSETFLRLQGSTLDCVVIAYDDLRDKSKALPTVLVCEWNGDIAQRIGITQLSRGVGSPEYKNLPRNSFTYQKTWRKFSLV